MFKTIDVWKRVGKSRAARYRCFQSLATGKFSVQSADWYSLNDPPPAAEAHERQHLELLMEQAPDERSGAYDTLEQAIAAHDAEFENVDE
ncbi:MAG: hypothetical protein ACRD3E_18820 [Terriglobales bacterium]